MNYHDCTFEFYFFRDIYAFRKNDLILRTVERIFFLPTESNSNALYVNCN